MYSMVFLQNTYLFYTFFKFYAIKILIMLNEKDIIYKTHKICIIGPGVVGTATGKAFIENGESVSFIGRGGEKIQNLKSEGFEAFAWDEITNGKFDFDISMLTVPTPTGSGEIDLSIMDKASRDLGKRIAALKKYHLVVVKSTVLPGTTRSLVAKNIEAYSGKKLGVDFGLCMNPEYLREETADADTFNPWIIVIGEYDKKSGDILESAYRNFDSPIYRVKIEEAEMQKYLHNIFNAAKISFFNEMREIGQEMGVDIEKIFKLVAISSEGIWNPKYGIKDKGPFMGSCLPKDTQAFLHWAEMEGYDASMLRAVIDVNKKIIKKQGLQKFVLGTQHAL